MIEDSATAALSSSPFASDPPVRPASREALPPAFLAGNSEMAVRARALDWSNTPVGEPATWPQSLKTAVSICIGSRYPIVVWWGHPAYTMFYNDGYVPILGVKKHPGWLGRSGRECWSEIWPIVGPMLDSVFATGEATWSEDLLLVMDRNIPREENYFTFSYSPIHDDADAVGGIFCACYETTGRVIGERRLRTLRDLNQLGGVTRTAEEACAASARALRENASDVPFSLIYLLEEDGGHARLVATTSLEPGSAAAPHRITLRDQTDATQSWPLGRVLEGAKADLISDLSAKFGPMPGGPWPEPAEAALIVPIAAPGHTKPTGFLVAGLSPRRVLDADYRSYLDLIAGHIGASVANARAYEEERKRAEALADIDRAKTAFFSNVSHEFRTPLTLMMGPLEDTLAHSNVLAAADRDRLALAHRNALRLIKLVNTLLDFSRIEAGRIEASYEPTDVAAFTAELASVFRSATERAGLKLIIDCPSLSEPVFLDREMWEKIVLNLLSNAFKFTLTGEIEVKVEADGREARLTVRDTGTGIPPDEIPRLFERFHRVKGARGRSYEGSGIGLSLVQELVRLHGGTVRAESELDRGSRFIVTIPLGSGHLPADRIAAARTLVSTATRAMAYAEEAERWLPAAEANSPRGGSSSGSVDATDPSCSSTGRVLLADDNADMREYVRGLLAQAGFAVETVADGEAALRAARARPPDVVLSDVMMPGLDGFGLLRELRGDLHLQTTPVILLSARAGEEARVEGADAGADDYLVKPFSARELVARVHAQVQLAHLRRSSSAALQAAMRENERQQRLYEAVASTTPDLVYVFDLQHRFTYANKALLNMWGRTWADAIGKNCLELGYEPSHAARHDREIDEVVATRRPIRGEVAFTGTSGRRLYDYIFAPVLDADGEVEAVAGTTRDVTDQRNATAAARFVAGLVEELVPLDREEEIVRRTVAAVGRHFGVHRCYFVEGLESRNLIRVSENWVRDDAPSLAGPLSLYDFGGAEWWRQYSAGNFAVEDTEAHPLINRQAAEHYAAVGVRAYAGQPIKRTGEWTVVLCITENHPRCWSDEELQLLDNVAARVWPLVERVRAETDLRVARDEAIAASRAKDDFLAVLSHELRTPLNPVLLIASESAEDAKLSEEVRADFKMVADNISLQARLIDDLLDFNRIVHGKVTLEPRLLDLFGVVRDAAATLHEEIAAKKISLKFSLHGPSPLVFGDPVRLRQVFWNVLKNAVKFTPIGGDIEIGSPPPPHAGEAEVRIRDTGIGMRPEELARIFHPFVQGRHTAAPGGTMYGGLGLGLAISRMLVDCHDGSIVAESPGPNQGSTIVIRLPAKAPLIGGVNHPGENGANGAPPPALGPDRPVHRVLLVDDHEPTRVALTRLLERRGYDVSVAHSVSDALQRADRSTFDVLISDLGLPDGDGCKLMTELRKKQSHLSGIAVSGFGMETDLARSRVAGFEEHLTKPVSIDSLDRALARVLERLKTAQHQAGPAAQDA